MSKPQTCWVLEGSGGSHCEDCRIVFAVFTRREDAEKTLAELTKLPASYGDDFEGLFYGDSYSLLEVPLDGIPLSMIHRQEDIAALPHDFSRVPGPNAKRLPIATEDWPPEVRRMREDLLARPRWEPVSR